MRYTIQAPERRFNGQVAGVAFADGRAEVDGDAHARALAYFRRKGYDVTAVATKRTGAAKTSDTSTQAEDDMPRKSASKADWKAYAIANGMDEAEAETLSRDQLVERFASEGDDQ